MSIPHSRYRTPDKNRMRIDPAAAVAGALPFPSRREGNGKWRTRGLCHGSGEKPDSASLIFHDPEHEGGQLAVHCYKCQPRTAAERDRIRHALQNATGLTLCRCDACWQAWRQGAQTAPGSRYPRNPTLSNQSNTNRRAESRSKPKSGQSRDGDTTAYAAQLWAAARVSTGAMQADHPVAKWLADRALWPPGVQMPDGVRWLPRTYDRFPHGRPGSAAAGALVMAMRQPSDPLGPVHKVQLVTITANGGKTQHWQDGDKRTFGRAPAYGLLTHWQLTATHGYDLHVCEGLADGLALLAGLPYRERAAALGKTSWEYARAGYIMVAVCAGTGYGRINPDLFDKVTLWPDADQAGITAARKAAQWWADLGRRVEIKLLPDGYDPAQYAKERK